MVGNVSLGGRPISSQYPYAVQFTSTVRFIPADAEDAHSQNVNKAGMSSATVLRLVLAAAVVLLQFFTVQSDQLCGLSGADSIIRGLAASVDATASGLFLAGAYTFAFKAPRSNQRARDFLKRWSKLHSEPSQNLKAGLKIDIRSKRFPRFTTTTRVGKIQVHNLYMITSGPFFVRTADQLLRSNQGR
jgi:hypothetical protein